MNEILFLIVINICLISLALLVFFHSWMPYFRPDFYFKYRIYDNNMLNYKDHKIFIPLKGRKEIYSINSVEYDKSGISPTIDELGVLTWEFEKGWNKPISHQKGEVNIRSELIQNAKNVAIDKILKGDKGMEDFLKTWGVVILAILIIALFGYLINQNQQTTKLIMNVTGR